MGEGGVTIPIIQWTDASTMDVGALTICTRLLVAMYDAMESAGFAAEWGAAAEMHLASLMYRRGDDWIDERCREIKIAAGHLRKDMNATADGFN